MTTDLLRSSADSPLSSTSKRLLAFAQEHGAGTVMIDSLKDMAPSLSDEATGQGINPAMQMCVAAGVEVLALHHQRKAQGVNTKPRKLADVYGSRWLIAGCGSVLMLWGEAGDSIVELTHPKQPSGVRQVGSRRSVTERCLAHRPPRPCPGPRGAAPRMRSNSPASARQGRMIFQGDLRDHIAGDGDLLGGGEAQCRRSV